MTEASSKSRRDMLKMGAILAGGGAAVLAACSEGSDVASAAGEAANAAMSGADKFVITPPPATTIPVAGTDKYFPVRRVYCLGRNYDAHAYESGDDPTQTPPFHFQKPTDAIVSPPQDIVYPADTQMLGYEAEMLVALKSGGSNITEADAAKHIYGYAISLDMTKRDIQAKAKEMQRPWEGAKSFDKSAPCSALHPVSETGILTDGRIWLSLNDVVKQDSDMKLMRWNVNEAIATLSQHFELKAGDVILTGTPEGVGLVKRGDVVKAGADGIDTLEIRIV